jgi:multicomponent Na+:H+ antiporter subunit B
MIDFILLFFLVVCAMAAIWMKDLLSAIIILAAYSLIMAVIWTRLNAVDVAFTEAAVGAGITTVLLMAVLSRTQRREENGQKSQFKNPKPETRNSKLIARHSILSLIIILVTGAVLVYGTIDMPNFGDPNAPANLHVIERYIEKSYEETGVVNFVTAILASYRGYDTLGEVVVIFTAGACVILLMRRKREQ